MVENWEGPTQWKAKGDGVWADGVLGQSEDREDTLGLRNSESMIVYVRGQQTFPGKGRRGNIFGFETTQCPSQLLNSTVRMQKQP